MARFAERSFALLAILALGGGAAAQDDSYLFAIPAERLAGSTGPLGDVIQATLHVEQPDRALAMITAAGALEPAPAGEGRIGVVLGRTPTLAAKPDRSHLADSFVIDFLELPVTRVARQLRSRYGDAPKIGDMTSFVNGYITEKTYVHDFHLASKVAATAEGDCTEHAVLLTALARSTGRPARVVLGVVLMETGDGARAYGHAWSEIYDGTRWQLADATMPASRELRSGPYYLPLLTLEHEGPGYLMDLLRITQVQPSRMTGIANANR